MGGPPGAAPGDRHPDHADVARAEAFLVAIPTYNERDSVGGLLDSLLDHHPGAHVIVIDDASPDGTGDLVAARAAADGRIHLLRRDRKAGIGSAYRAAFAWALERDYALVVSMDADGSHDPRELGRLLAALPGADVVVGSRYVPGGRIHHWPWSRRLLSRLANQLARLVVGRQVRDWTAGFKCYRARVLAALSFGPGGIASEGYGFQVEILYHCHRSGFRLREVPITFVDRRQGRTKMSRAEVYRAALTLLRLGRLRLARQRAAR